MNQKIQKKFTLTQLAHAANARLIGDSNVEVCRVASFESAGPDSITFASDEKLIEKIGDCKAAAIIVGKEIKSPISLLVVDSVEKALIKVLGEFMPQLEKQPEGIHETAIIHKDSQIDKTASIGPFVNIKKGVKIGAKTFVGSGCVIGENSIIGSGCQIEDNVVIYHNCVIGNNCIIGANSTIGMTGFGYYFIDGRHQQIPHTGGVVIEDFVEIGANSCVDRAKFGNTVIGAGTKIDNLVQIAHNVVIGKCCLVVSQAGIAGSSKLGTGVVVAAQAGIKDHITIGDGTIVGAQAGVINDHGANKKIIGSPAIDSKVKYRQVYLTHKLPEMHKQLKELIKKVEEIETSKDNS